MRRVVVIGGGISGLAAAWAVRQAAGGIDGGVEVLVLEREARVGGKARTIARDGWMMEAGPGGFLGGRPEVDRLLAASGMEGECVTANKAAAHRFLMIDGKIREVATNPVAFARSGILSAGGFLRMIGEPFIPRRTDGADESIWQFAARRLGAQVADRMISPMMLGIYAADARQLSVEAAFPRMTALERDHGSIILGMIAKRGKTRSGVLTSFRGGMQSFPTALAERGGFAVRCDAEVRALARAERGWEVAVAGDRETIPADAVILAAEPFAAAPLLRTQDQAAAAELESIACPPVAVVGLGFGAGEAARVPNGFGVLIARGEGLRALGNLWESRFYPGRSPEGTVLIRALFGGQVDPEAGAMSEAELVALARGEVERLYGFTSPPVMQEVHRWPRAVPHYELGHVQRVQRIERAVAALPGLFITGYGLRAIGFADAAVNGVRCGEGAGKWLRESGSGRADPGARNCAIAASA
ncbi:MAG: protoporphyrinogen oxidase [Gemmatimonadaceae bacterium]|nr:protoporphyrinogen oxidase [Gemmatimonadaceae bacterium]